jgi:8-oxo-dGTP pyrophosphatase MutT (NUDIX family)
LAWLTRTDDVFRRVKPATPDPHLVSYVVPVDPDSGHLLLGAHLNAGLWLPPGGHVEVDEQPADTAHCEAAEELGIDTSGRLSDGPVSLSVTETVGPPSPAPTRPAVPTARDGRRPLWHRHERRDGHRGPTCRQAS